MGGEHQIPHNKAAIINAVCPVPVCKYCQNHRRAIEWVEAFLPTPDLSVGLRVYAFDFKNNRYCSGRPRQHRDWRRSLQTYSIRHASRASIEVGWKEDRFCMVFSTILDYTA